MARVVNIVRRSGTYHFRRVVPVHIRPRLQRRELVRSLETTTSTTGKLRADLLYRASEFLFSAAARPMLSQDRLARLVRDFYDLSLSINDHQRMLDGQLSDEQLTAGIDHLDWTLAEQRGALARNHFDQPAMNLASAIALGRSGLKREELAPGEDSQIRQALMRASIDILQALRARHDGDFTYEPRDALLRKVPAAGCAFLAVPTAQGAGPPCRMSELPSVRSRP